MKLLEMTKDKYTITLSYEVMKWIYTNIDNRRFSSVSHAVEFLAFTAMKKEKEKDVKDD